LADYWWWRNHDDMWRLAFHLSELDGGDDE
jgi:hypothetical protein